MLYNNILLYVVIYALCKNRTHGDRLEGEHVTTTPIVQIG